ncbi:hypothetical protein HD554DRAFT_2150096 [Boletus coccyginus]|nr:hypothetical protein HD554DRAFT_2150096 [Boletus coccyginus]
MTEHSFLNDSHVKDMVEQIAHCYELHEALSSQIRPLGRVEQQAAYDAACLEWQQPDKPNSVPMDTRRRKPFFEKCQAMFQSNSTTTKDRFLVSFACYAMRSGHSLELDSHPKKDSIIGEAKRVAMERISSAQPHVLLFPKRSDLPAHIAQALFPDDIDAMPPSDALAKPGPFLVGKSFEYRDDQTGHSVTCLVHDCGTSHLMGDWFEVSCDSEAPFRITQSEMTEFWEARVTDPE